MHGLPRACHSGELACLALQIVLSAHVTFAPPARMHQSFSRTLRSQTHIFPMGPKLRYSAVPVLYDDITGVRDPLHYHYYDREYCDSMILGFNMHDTKWSHDETQ